MKHCKLLSLFIILLILIPTFSSLVIADSNEKGVIKTKLDKFLTEKLFNLMSYTFGTRYYYLEISPPSFYMAKPETINLKFLNDTNIEISSIVAETGKIKKAINSDPFLDFVTPARYFKFDLVIPENESELLWYGKFDPQVIDILPSDTNIKEEDIPDITTNLKLSVVVPPDASMPVEDVVLKVKITRTEIMGNNLYIAPNVGPWEDNPVQKILWLIPALTTFGRYSGITEEVVQYLNILVKVEDLHNAEIIPPEPLVLGPNEITTVPIQVENLGNRIDTFNFDLNTNNTNKDVLVIAPPPSLTIEPGEIGTVYMSIATPHTINDPGTTHPIDIEMYSIKQPNIVFTNTVTVTTRGMSVSEANLFYSLFIFGIIIVFLVIIFYFRKMKMSSICTKPDKPWKIEEEQKYLEELKEKDKDEYNEILEMMNDEYKSSLLWYKYYCKAKSSRRKKEHKDYLSGLNLKGLKGSLTGLVDRLRIKTDEEPEEEPEDEPEEIEPEVEEVTDEEIPEEEPEEEKIEEKPVKKGPRFEEVDTDSLKNEALKRIKEEQEKQKRKYKK